MEMKGENCTGQRGGVLSQSCLVPITGFHSHFKRGNVSTNWLPPPYLCWFLSWLLTGVNKSSYKKKCTANPSAALRKKSILCPYKNFHRKILLQIAKSNMVKLRTSKPGMLFLTSWCREQVEVLRDVQYLV